MNKPLKKHIKKVQKENKERFNPFKTIPKDILISRLQREIYCLTKEVDGSKFSICGLIFSFLFGILISFLTFLIIISTYIKLLKEGLL